MNTRSTISQQALKASVASYNRRPYLVFDDWCLLTHPFRQVSRFSPDGYYSQIFMYAPDGEHKSHVDIPMTRTHTQLLLEIPTRMLKHFPSRYTRLFTVLAGLVMASTILSAQTPGPNPVVDTEGDMGIGTNQPDPSAALDINSDHGGLLIPRLTTAQRDAIVEPAVGLMIFNSETGTFEFNSGTTFEPVWSEVLNTTNLSNYGWSLTGNEASSENFLGTTNETVLAVRTNDVERMRVDTDGNVGIGTTDPNVSADVNGALAIQPPGTVSVTQNLQTITVGNRSYIRILSDSVTSAREILLTNGLQDGQVLILQCLTPCDTENVEAPPQGVYLQTGSNVILGYDTGWLLLNDYDMQFMDTLTLIWDGSINAWVEVARSMKSLCGGEGRSNPGISNSPN